MKTNLFKMLTVIVFAAIAGYNVYSSQKPEVMSDLALENVEALAGNESNSEFTSTTCCIATTDNVSCHGCNGYTYSYAYRQ